MQLVHHTHLALLGVMYRTKCGQELELGLWMTVQMLNHIHNLFFLNGDGWKISKHLRTDYCVSKFFVDGVDDVLQNSY